MHSNCTPELWPCFNSILYIDVPRSTCTHVVSAIGIIIYIEEQMVRICLFVYVCVAPPMIVGVWSMAVMLWQLHEYYYYIYYSICARVVP